MADILLLSGGIVSSFCENDGAVFISRHDPAVPRTGTTRRRNRARAPPYSSEIGNRKLLPNLQQLIYRRMRWNMYLRLNGILIEVSKDVYKNFYKRQRKDRYISVDLKTGTSRKKKNGKEVYLPSREVSLEWCMEQGISFQDDMDVEEQVIKAILEETLRRALQSLTDEELSLIHGIYYERQSVSAMARRKGVSREEIRKRRDRILSKLRKWF